MSTATYNSIAYQTYRFGRARQRFRGPKPDLSGPYVSFIGGSEVFGKFVGDPFPKLVGDQLGFTCANWGTPGAGPSFFLKDPVVLEACSNSQVCVVSAMGAVATSNRLYSVFKRRNSRLRDTSKTLRALFPELKLDEFRFAHNMLRRMYAENPNNFKVVEIELREAWIARMRELLDEIETVKVLLWMSTRTPEEDAGPSERKSFVTHPAFVNREMLEAIAPMADLVVEYVPSHDAMQFAHDEIQDMGFDEPALPCPSQMMHTQVAEILTGALKDVLAESAGTRQKVMAMR